MSIIMVYSTSIQSKKLSKEFDNMKHHIWSFNFLYHYVIVQRIHFQQFLYIQYIYIGVLETYLNLSTSIYTGILNSSVFTHAPRNYENLNLQEKNFQMLPLLQYDFNVVQGRLQTTCAFA